ncbi:DUF2812 domain-containing protein [Helcococcus kunzii]|uniref:DUF2812 domain-containing protein n=1 Tax=Helcococcus kunzii ATCC 51366 TaxID=883114 RepID=H3NR05_9FIRM|nr:DUF2812 domain-containing protein [Helcococcus kunzii]EHR31953.1 hypothetical protein HMPREF9709_01766 [Helcococcus kunzii ATCC 51366]QZO76370.1 DUF2812 domain-containing protein [Helcococcus kunzii]
MIKIKFFIDPVSQLEPWLNKISNEGYRLVSVKRFIYKFEKTNKKYSYTTQFVGTKPWNEIKDYVRMLEENGSNTFFAPLNQGNVSFGKVRLRPFAESSAKIATGFTNFNREILIAENVGQNQPLLTDPFDIANEYKHLRNTYLNGLILLLCMLVFSIYMLVHNGGNILGYSLLGILSAVTVWVLFLTSRAHLNYRRYFNY